MMFDFIEEGYQEGDRVWNMAFQRWETIIQINLRVTYSVETEEDSYTSRGSAVLGEKIPTIYPNEFKLYIPVKAYKRPLRDKDFVECWDNSSVFTRTLRFYDAKNNCTFSGMRGYRRNCFYDNYKKVPMPDWAKELKAKLED